MDANNTTHPGQEPRPLNIPVGVVLILLIVITVAGNVVVCLAVGLNRRLRSLTNCFIVSLAITDLLLGLLVLPFSALYQLTFAWDLGRAFCDIYTSLDVMLCTASILNLFMISLDRYCAVTDPLRYPVRVTPARVAAALVFIWAVSITLSFLSIHLGWNSRHHRGAAAAAPGPQDAARTCKVEVNLVYGLVDGLVTFYLPLLVMCVTYYRIFRIAREQARRIQQGGSWQAATVREHKATVTLAAVMGAFVVCWFPYFSVFLYRGLMGDGGINQVLEAVVLWLGYANSALNPILYGALNRDFRTAYQQLFRCSLAGHPAHEASVRSTSSQLGRTGSRERARLQEQSGAEIAPPLGATDRKPSGCCPGCSGDLLTCCKSLWGLRLLRRPPQREPPEEPPGEPLNEESLRTPAGAGGRTLLPTQTV
ncbi:histamine H2 receptor isoform X1 [Sorex araneus]|uniref:histamine H2 receptor isoform X1 n=1 Tax=Sorex araneus TaxID=42254 RepID=UPI00064B0EEB|nr:histamine H2 receptor isoform X1 [Sorex araneus]